MKQSHRYRALLVSSGERKGRGSIKVRKKKSTVGCKTGYQAVFTNGNIINILGNNCKRSINFKNCSKNE